MKFVIYLQKSPSSIPIANISQYASMTGANVFSPLFPSSHVYVVCGTCVPSSPPPSLPPLHLLPLPPDMVHHSSSSSRWCPEYTARIRGISDRQSVPELVPRRRSLSFSGWSSDALCLPLTLTHNTCACCVVVCYISVFSRFRPLYFPALVYFSETTCFYKTAVTL